MKKYLQFLKEERECYIEKDPSIDSHWIVRFMPGYKAIRGWYFTHWLFEKGHTTLARIISLRIQKKTGVDIHPGATIGKRFFIDHGVGVVIGETCIIGDDVMVYQGVTLGATGKITGLRHPIVEDNVMIGAGAKIVGRITLGKNCKVGAGAIVVRDVEPNTTVVCPPAYPVHHKNQKLSFLCKKGRPRWIVPKGNSSNPSPVFVNCPAYEEEKGNDDNIPFEEWKNQIQITQTFHAPSESFPG